MTITYKWEVTGLKTSDVGTKTDAVVQTYWKKIGTDENGVTGTFSGATPFTVDSSDESGPFIPFEQLTEQDIISWIQSIVVGHYEQHVNDQILKEMTKKINVVVDKPLPWNPPPTEIPEIPTT